MRRILSVGSCAVSAFLATALMPGTASAATSDDCSASTSTKAFTGGLFGNTTDHLWVDHPTSTRTVVCFQFRSLPVGGLTVVADVSSSATPPDVVVGDNAALCPNVIATLNDPVAIRLAVGLSTNSVCLSVDGSTVSLRFVPGNVDPSSLPVLEIWRDGGSRWGWLDVAACPTEWALAVAFGTPTTCMSTNERLFP